MEKTYDSFIELSPGYESVVDVSSEERQKDFWTRYIVNDDIVKAVSLLSKSLRPNDMKTDVWHFWIQGAYGTGKTYSAIVLKHLLQEDISVVENFMKNKLFADVKDKFLSIRKKGPFYVKFKSGECRQLNTSNKFLFQIEQSIREILRENNFTYTGRKSLIDSVKAKTKDFRNTLAEDFDNGLFPEYWSQYSNFDEFYALVDVGDITACSAAQEILQAKDIGLATNLDTFKAWIKDVFDGNPELGKTGVFIIWDEFTDYIRYNDLDIIQQLSLFSKEVNFFMIYVIHEYPGLLTFTEEKLMNKAEARFHKIDITLSDKTTFKLIGESIATKDGMKSNWDEICDDLYTSIKGIAHEFMQDPSADMTATDLKNIFPMHPMTVNLVSKVAGLAASNRSIFKFLKGNDDDGFKQFIHDNGPDGWKWVTPDYLWDYYFVRDGGSVKESTPDAEACLKHYNKSERLINDDKVLRVFKASMLLLATIGSGRSMLKSRNNKSIRPTLNTLVKCFYGQLDKDVIVEYLNALKELKLIMLAEDRDDIRIELPYSGGEDDLDIAISNLKKQQPVSKLFDVTDEFGKQLKTQFLPDAKAVIKRIEVDTCWGITQQIKNKLAKLSISVEKAPHKFGLLLIAVSNLSDEDKFKTVIGEFMHEESTNRVIACLLRTPLLEKDLNLWYSYSANANLAQKSNNSVNRDSYTKEASFLISTWIASAIGKDMLLFDSTGNGSLIYTNNGAITHIEKIVLDMYKNAPETIIKKVTLYKSGGINPAYWGLTRVTLRNKSMADDRQKAFNKQYQDIVDVLIDAGVWDCTTIEELEALNINKAQQSITYLCTFLNKQLSSGSVILTDLWSELQNKLGYYDNLVCCYLLGFAFYFFNGKYTWYDGNNSYRLNEDTIPPMIVAMCGNKAAGMKISSESDVEKRFKQISTKFFSLQPNEAGDADECRKNIRVKILKNGFPFWTLKYLNDNCYAGIKQSICEIVDKYQEFILVQGNQSAVMEDIIGLVKVNAKLYTKMIPELLKAKADLTEGMRSFIFNNSVQIQKVCDQYNFTLNTLLKLLSQSLEEETWQWKEEEVTSRTSTIALDLELVGIANEALEGKAESVEKVRETLIEYLSYIRIPGCVYEKSKFAWAKAVEKMYDISVNKWVGWKNEEKQTTLDVLRTHMKDAVANIDKPTSVLKEYISSIGYGSLSVDEVEKILDSLTKESYLQTEQNFKTNIKKQIYELAYLKKIKSVSILWKDATGTKSISEWITNNQMLPEWVLPNMLEVFNVMSSIDDNVRIDNTQLENAIAVLQSEDFSALGNLDELNKCFITNVASEKHFQLLYPHIDALKTKIRGKFRNPISWAANIVAIRKIAESFMTTDLKSESSDRAKKKIQHMSEAELREEVSRLLESSSEACMFLLNE